MKISYCRYCFAVLCNTNMKLGYQNCPYKGYRRLINVTSTVRALLGARCLFTNRILHTVMDINHSEVARIYQLQCLERL